MNFDDINTDAMFQKLLNKMTEFYALHEKGEVPGRKDLLDYLILRLRIESSDECLITIERNSESVIITIESEEIIYIDEVPTLKQLIQIANAFKIYPTYNGVVLKMTCYLWEWKAQPKIVE